jgi:predicted transposase YdaD
MADHWDFVIKKILRENPQQFVSWILKGAVINSILSVEIKRKSIYADALFEVIYYGQLILLHLEFQSTKDKRMGERLLEYNVQASKEHGYLPVHTCVIYLRKTAEVPKPPFIRRLPDGSETLRFTYQIIELWKMSAQAIFQEGLDGLLPLVLFTDNAKQPNVLDEVVERLRVSQNKDLSALTFTLVGLIFQNGTDRELVMRRFAMLGDLLGESWTYNEILHKGFAKGEKEGWEKGMEKERIASRREMLLSIVQVRFPDLLTEAHEHADRVEDPSMALKIVSAQSGEEAKKLLSELK